MTIIEQRTMEIVDATLPRMAKELARANRLKALEIKMRIEQSRNGVGLSGGTLHDYESELDGIMEGCQ